MAMIIIEQLVYGIDSAGNSSSRTLLGMSSGMGREVAGEIQRFCDGWGHAPALGLRHPALLSFPLENTMSSQRGRLYAVIRVEPGTMPVFHAAVLSDAAYAKLGYNPFTLSSAEFFIWGWRPGVAVERVQVSPEALSNPEVLPVCADDLGLVDEALHKLLAEGALQLPIEQALGSSDRALALILAALPPSLRKNQRFASFATSGFNNYTLAAREKEGSSFAGWKRWFMAQPDVPMDGVRAEYVQAVRDCLKAGDLKRLESASVELERNLPRSGREGLGSANRNPALETTTPGAEIALPGTTRPSGRTAAKPLATSSAVREDAYRPVRGAGPAKPIRTGTASGDAGDRPRVRRSARARLVRQPVRISQVGNRKLPGSIAMTVVFVVAGLAAYTWLSHGGQDGGFGWAVLKDRVTGAAPSRTASLLEVVNVGRTYNRLVKKVAQSGFGGLVDTGSRDRNAALGTLQVEAAAPLLQQVELFLQLAQEGIQQGNRPDRETRRLESLAGQGEVLLQEMTRLEMAWYSLSTGADWTDLGDMPDQTVRTRRDSLLRHSPEALADAGRELGTVDVRKRFQLAKGQMEGMRALLVLFQERQWSQAWEDELYRAAELVSPSASGMTRAYRNAAFVLVRLKKAERLAAHRNLPFAEELGESDWPCAEVQDVLPSLRKQVRKFAAGESPDLLTDVANMYAYLGKPMDLVMSATDSPATLTKLEKSTCYTFDPASYQDYVARIRFEAASTMMESNPESLTDVYLIDRQGASDDVFRQALQQPLNPQLWEELAQQDMPAFFARWADRQAHRARESLFVRQQDFDQNYRDCIELMAVLDRRIVAGQDWTGSWLDLSEKVSAARGGLVGDDGGDRVRAGRLARLDTLSTEMNQGRSLPLANVTVRLNRDDLAAEAVVVLKFRIEPDGQELVSSPFALGPAAPAGSGWVGTGSLDWSPVVYPDSGFQAEVQIEATGETLLEVDWASLNQRMGAGALCRPREGAAGSVKFRLDPDYWSELSLSQLE
jgi:hypothetical protein